MPSMFGHIGAHAGDPILSLNEDFQKDPRANKTNLGIGVYVDESGTLPRMGAVARADAVVGERVAGEAGAVDFLAALRVWRFSS